MKPCYYNFKYLSLMGQSQSAVEKHKTLPIRPNRIFGFLFFQREYDAVMKSIEQMEKLEVEKLLMKEKQSAYKIWVA